MSRPSRLTRPAGGFRGPETTLKRVVFPAPLGPIRPVIRPFGTSMLTSESTRLPPNRTLTLSTASISGLLGADGAPDHAQVLGREGPLDAHQLEGHVVGLL